MYIKNLAVSIFFFFFFFCLFCFFFRTFCVTIDVYNVQTVVKFMCYVQMNSKVNGLKIENSKHSFI